MLAHREDLELFRRQKQAMLASSLPTRFILGKVVEDVIHDDVVDEADDVIITRALDKQQEVWNLIMLTDTLMLGITYGQTTESPEPHATFSEAAAGTLSAAYTLLMTCSCVGFLLGTALTGLIYAYSKVLYQPDDIIWFFVSIQHEVPIVLMIASLVLFFLGGLLGSALTHGPTLGLLLAAVWLAALVFLAVAWNTMRNGLMSRFTQEHRLKRTLEGQRTDPRPAPGRGANAGGGARHDDLEHEMSSRDGGASDAHRQCHSCAMTMGSRYLQDEPTHGDTPCPVAPPQQLEPHSEKVLL